MKAGAFLALLIGAFVAASLFLKPKQPAPENAGPGKGDSAKGPENPADPPKGTDYAMPANGGVWPWPVGVHTEGKPTVPVSLAAVVAPSRFVHGAAVNPVAGKAIVAFWDTNFKDKMSGTHLVWLDLASGTIAQRWQLKDVRYAPADVHVDGKRFLVRNAGGIGPDRDTLELFDIAADGTLQQRSWRPAQTSPSRKKADNEVRWAGFVGRNHIATVCGNGVLGVWTLDGLEQVGSFPSVNGFPTVTPDGLRLAFATGDHVALLDPAAGQIIGERNLGSMPKDVVLAFNSDGSMLACAGEGRVALLDLRQGQTWDAMISELKIRAANSTPDFGWVGDNYLYHSGSLYELNTPVPVWNYNGPKWASPRGNEFWTVTQSFSDKELVFRSFRLPHPTVTTRLAQALQQPDLFALRPGDSIRIDVSGLPMDRQQEYRGVLERRATERGYKPSDTASIVLQASLAPNSVERTVTYFIGGKSVACSYSQRDAKLKILKDGRVLWEASGAKHPPGLISVPSGVDIQAHVRENYGAPDEKLFTERPLPGVIRGDKSTRTVFGSSDLGASGIRDR